MKKLSFTVRSAKCEEFSAKFPRETSKVGGFYTIWPMHHRSILAKNLFAFNQASSSTFPAAENTALKKEMRERRRKNKHKQKSHKRGTASETNHEAEQEENRIEKEIKKKAAQRTREKKIFP